MRDSFDRVLLVTGGAGFIGSAFLRLNVPRHPNWLFVNLDALTYAGDLKKVESIAKSNNYRFFQGDICNRKLLESIFDEFEINVVINFAAESHVDNSIDESSAFIMTNIVGTHTLLDVTYKRWINKSRDGFYRFIQISTDEVYGSLSKSQESSKELSGYFPNSPYSASKASADLLCRSYFKTFDFPVIITRSSNNYGPYQNIEKLIPKIISKSLNNEKIPIYGDGSNIREWIYVDDNCEAILNVINQGNVGEIYNIGGKVETTNIFLAKMILKNMGLSEDNLTFVEDRLGHDFRYSLNTEKLKQLGWEEKFDFELGLKFTIKHYQELFSPKIETIKDGK